MAIKIRCVDCKKKISIDEAFAGGVCRCPYCTAIVYVPDDAGQKNDTKRRPETPKPRPKAPGARPESPTTAARTAKAETLVPVDTMAETAIDAPAPAKKPAPLKTATQTEAEKAIVAARGQKNIPTAAPVKFQGIVAIILLVLMLGMLGGMVYLGIRLTKPPGDGFVPENDPKKTNVFASTDFPSVAGKIKVTAPVVYLIDTSKPMGNAFEAAGNIVIASARSLKGGKFNVILVGEEKDKTLSPQPIASDPAGIAKAKAFITMELCGEADQARGLQAALAMKAKTVVLLACDDAPRAKDVAEGPFKAQSVKLHTIVLGRTHFVFTDTGQLYYRATPESLWHVFTELVHTT